MGNKKSVPSDTSAEFIIENYEFYKKCLDARFGEVKWLKNSKDGTVVLQKDSILNSQKEYENHINQIKKRSSIYHPNIIRVLAFNTKHEEVFCANYHKISTFFEAFEIDLEEIVEAKISKSVKSFHKLLTSKLFCHRHACLKQSFGIFSTVSWRPVRTCKTTTNFMATLGLSAF